MSDQTDVLQGTMDLLSLTKAGRTQLAVEVSKWERLSAGVNLLLHKT